jgi:hypothetical protein
VKNPKFTCLLWTVIFLTLAGASGWFVHRRAPEGPGAVVGGLIGGVLLVIVVSWLSAIPQRLYEWWLIVRAKMGSTPRYGRWSAIIGVLRGHGELTSPFTRERCVLYGYEVVADDVHDGSHSYREAYEGFAMVPLSIEHGVERTRILAKPKIPSLKSQPVRGAFAESNAQQFVSDTAFEPAPAKKNDEPDLTRGDGHLRYDYRTEPLVTDLRGCRLNEFFLRADQEVCVLGDYKADRHALVGEVNIRTGSTIAIDAAWRVVNAGIAAMIFAAFALAAATIFCVNFPLEAVEQSHPHWKLNWWELDIERFIDRRVRPPLVEYGVLTKPGFYLQDVCMDCARGRLEVDDRVIELKHAAYIGERAVHLSEQPGDRDGVTLRDGKIVELTVAGKTASVPASWIAPNDVQTALGTNGEYSGRVTVVAPDRWIRCRVYFKTDVDADAWLASRRR